MRPLRALRRPVPLLVLTLLLAGAGCEDPSTPGAGQAGSQTEGKQDPPSAGTDAGQILARVAEAERTAPFHGHAVTIYGAPGEARQTRMEIFRRAGGDTFLAWEGGEGARSWKVADGRPWLTRPDLLVASYEVTLDAADGTNVAWRPVRRLRIRPRHPLRPSLEVLLDAEKMVVLREEHRRADGGVRLVREIETVEFGPPEIPAEFLAAEEVGGAGSVPGDPAEPSGDRPLAPAWIPEGFEPETSAILSCGTSCEYWTDGLAALVLYQRPQEGSAGEDEVTEGARDGLPWVAAIRHGVRVRVGGSLPPEVLRRVLEGLVPRN